MYVCVCVWNLNSIFVLLSSSLSHHRNSEQMFGFFSSDLIPKSSFLAICRCSGTIQMVVTDNENTFFRH